MKFRGRKQYPLFRFHEPGFEPWYLNEGQAAFLQLTLPQIITLLPRAQEQKEFFLPDNERIRCYSPLQEGDGWRWEESFTEASAPPRKIVVPRLDELEVQRFIKQYGRGTAVLELDYFYLPAMVQEGHKPHYPRLVMVVDEQGPIVTLEFVEQGGGVHKAVQQQLCAAFERIGQVPQTVVVQREDLGHMLDHYAELFGFEVQIQDTLPALEEAKDSMSGALDSLTPEEF